jgi:hypothetical protein
MHDPECTCAICREDSVRRDGWGVDFARYAETLRVYRKKVRHEELERIKARKQERKRK